MTQERNCENCAHYHMEAYEWPCNVCEASYDNPPTKWEKPEDKPQTNADHIKSMSDEDLADLLIQLCGNANSCDDCSLYGQGMCPETQHEFEWLEWLQQPYKEESK